MQQGKYIIRRASLPADAEEIMEVFAAARAIMVASGNLSQWNNGYPSLESVQADIERNGSFVIEERQSGNEQESETGGRIVAYFAYLPSPEPTYSKIYDGEWLDDTLPYHVVHRIASRPDAHGIFKMIMDFCFAHESNIRIDTHKDNHIMQHNIMKHGFTYCGIIHLLSGDERLAYQRIDLDLSSKTEINTAAFEKTKFQYQ
ncbi:MAG: N-acetyltransferase [Bacteroidaceae bacterium]|nr:N-acetyltransferase [Bacteroidaceae bacterium]